MKLFNSVKLEDKILGVSSGSGTPDSISNSAVKPASADGPLVYRGRVGRCREFCS